MTTLQRAVPISPRLFLVLVIGTLGVAAAALLIVSVANGEPPLPFALTYFAIWVWNAYWWAWQTPIQVEVDTEGGLTFVSAAGHRTHVQITTIRSVTMSPVMVPVVRHDRGRIWLLPVAPIADVIGLLENQSPPVRIDIPASARRWMR